MNGRNRIVIMHYCQTLKEIKLSIFCCRSFCRSIRTSGLYTSLHTTNKCVIERQCLFICMFKFRNYSTDFDKIWCFGSTYYREHFLWSNLYRSNITLTLHQDQIKLCHLSKMCLIVRSIKYRSHQDV